MSATMNAMTLRLADYLACLTAIPWTQPRYQMWSSAAEFRTTLSWTLSCPRILGKYLALPKFINYLSGSRNSRLFFLVNNIGHCLKWSKKLSELLALEDVSVLVLEVHSQMDKNKKFIVAWIFLTHLAGMMPRALVATSAGTVCLGSTNFLCLGYRLRHVNPLGMT